MNVSSSWFVTDVVNESKTLTDVFLRILCKNSFRAQVAYHKFNLEMQLGYHDSAETWLMQRSFIVSITMIVFADRIQTKLIRHSAQNIFSLAFSPVLLRSLVSWAEVRY